MCKLLRLVSSVAQVSFMKGSVSDRSAIAFLELLIMQRRRDRFEEGKTLAPDARVNILFIRQISQNTEIRELTTPLIRYVRMYWFKKLTGIRVNRRYNETKCYVSRLNFNQLVIFDCRSRVMQLLRVLILPTE